MKQGLMFMVLSGLLVWGCGGDEKTVKDPSNSEVANDETEDEEDELIPEEKFEEIRHTFESKSSHISRCFPEAVEAGELNQNERVKLTVGLTIQKDGRPTDIKILETTKKSAAVEACVVRTVGRWQFTTLPSPIQHSYGFVLQHF